jgi:hypothetical protein
MTSKFENSNGKLENLPPAMAKFFKLVCKLANRKKGCTLEELAQRSGYTKNSCSHRLSHLRAAGFKVPELVRSNAAEE